MPTATKTWDFSIDEQGFAPVPVIPSQANVAGGSPWQYASGAWTCRNLRSWTRTVQVTAEIYLETSTTWYDGEFWYQAWSDAEEPGGTQGVGPWLAEHRHHVEYPAQEYGDQCDVWLTKSHTGYPSTWLSPFIYDFSLFTRLYVQGFVRVRKLTHAITYTPMDGGSPVVVTSVDDFGTGDCGYIAQAIPNAWGTAEYDGTHGWWRLGGKGPWNLLQPTVLSIHKTHPWDAPCNFADALKDSDAFTFGGLGLSDGDTISEIRWIVNREWLWSASPGGWDLDLGLVALDWRSYKPPYSILASQQPVDSEVLSGVSGGPANHTTTTTGSYLVSHVGASSIWAISLGMPLVTGYDTLDPNLLSWLVTIHSLEVQVDYTTGTPTAGTGICLVRDYTKIRYVFLPAATDLGDGMPAGSLVVREDSSADTARQYLPVDSNTGCSWPSFYMDGPHMVGAYLRGTTPYLAIGSHGRNWNLVAIPTWTVTALAFAPHNGRYVALGFHDAQWYCRVGLMATDGSVTWSSEVSLALTSPQAAGWLRPREDGVLEFAYLNASGSPEIVTGYAIALDGTGPWT